MNPLNQAAEDWLKARERFKVNPTQTYLKEYCEYHENFYTLFSTLWQGDKYLMNQAFIACKQSLLGRSKNS